MVANHLRNPVSRWRRASYGRICFLVSRTPLGYSVSMSTVVGCTSFVGHGSSRAQGMFRGLQRIAVPVIFQYSENAFDRIVFAVIGRIAG